MNIKFSFIAFAILAALFGCSNDDAQNASSEYINSVRVSVDDFIPEGSATRTAYTVDNTGFHFTWTDGDALGIYPIGGDQVKFPISSGDGSASAAFDGGAWKLRSSYQYAAYYPFSAANYTIAQTALPASFTGQTQNGNNTTAHLSTYDYLACAATTPNANGGVDLTMKHLGAFLRLQLTMPKADTYSSVVLESDGVEFVTTGTFDLTAATPAITSTATSSTFTINFSNISTTAKNEVITVYAILAPSDLSTSNIKVTVHGTGLTTYVQTVTGKNFQARSAYNIAVTSFPSGTNASGEDVNWEEETATTGTTDGYDWVDLELPSGTKWATMNVGASKPEDSGDYFAWGETEPYYLSLKDTIIWKVTKEKGYCWASYKHCNGTARTLTKYCTNSKYGIVDNDTVLDAKDDAATANWGSNWRMPTTEELHEVMNDKYITREWTTMNGVYGRKITSKKNGNSIFLPETGYFGHGGQIFIAGFDEYYNSICCYWTSSLLTQQPDRAYHACFSISSNYTSEDRYYGMAVRPVRQ